MIKYKTKKVSRSIGFGAVSLIMITLFMVGLGVTFLPVLASSVEASSGGREMKNEETSIDEMEDIMVHGEGEDELSVSYLCAHP